jgi:acid phosphatase
MCKNVQVFINSRVNKPFAIYSSFPLFSIALLAANTISLSRDSYHFNPLEHLSGVAPLFDAFDPLPKPSPPQGWNITRTAYLIRHAAVYANDFDYETYISPFVQKLSNTTVDSSHIPALSFLSTWTDPINCGAGDVDKTREAGGYKTGCGY